MFVLFNDEICLNNQRITNNFNDKVILDVKVDFELKKLMDYDVWNAYRAMRCAKQNAVDGEIVRLLFPRKLRIFHKNLFYLQKIIVKIDPKFINQEIYLLEDVVAAMCSKNLPDDVGWIYAAYHKKLRIICGVGKGVILSRSLSSRNMDCEIGRTLTYLKRFEFADKFKIFRDNFSKALSKTTFCKELQQIYLENESHLIDFADKNVGSIFQLNRPKFQASLEVASNILFLLSFCCFCSGVLLHYYNQDQAVFLNRECIENDNFRLVINENNVDHIKHFFDMFSGEFFPWNDIAKIQNKYGQLDIEKISLAPDEDKIFFKKISEAQLKEKSKIKQTKGESVICIKK